MKYFVDLKGMDDSKEYNDPYEAFEDILDFIGIARVGVFKYGSSRAKEQSQAFDVLFDYFMKNKTIVEVFEQNDEDSCYSYFDSMYEAKNNY